jgi:hypothetical protein
MWNPIHIEARQGDLIPVAVSLNSSPGVPDNLTGFTIGLTIKGSPGDSDEAAFYISDVAGSGTAPVAWAIPGWGASPLENTWWGETTFPCGSFYLEISQWDSSNNRVVKGDGTLVIKPAITGRQVPD